MVRVFTVDGDHRCIISFGCRTAFVDHKYLDTSSITSHLS